MPKSVPVRIDRKLYDDANTTADLKSRSIAQQIAHWARIGRALETSPEVTEQRISRVLAGTTAYDELSSREQAIVRAEWDRRIESRVDALRLDQEFECEDRSYVELDQEGRVVQRTSDEQAGADRER